MNWKRYAMAVVAVLVMLLATGFLVHGMLLAEDYKALGSIMRSPEDAAAHFPYMLLEQLLMALAIVWIYAKGVEPKPWLGQGVRFGLALWVLSGVATYLIYFAVEPLPSSLVTKQIVFGLLEGVPAGIVAAAVYRK